LLPSLDPQGGKCGSGGGGVSIGKRRAAFLLYGKGCKGSEKSMGVGAKTATIFKRKRHQNMRTTVNGGDRLHGGLARVEFPVFSLLRSITRDSRDLL